MKSYLLCFSWLLLLAGCQDKPAAETHDAFWASTRPDSVVLKKGLGTLYLRVPRAYDTLMVWLRESDCVGCGDYRFRLQPRTLPIHQENGFFFPTQFDSANQLTIVHPEFIEPGGHRGIDDSVARTEHQKYVSYFYTIRRCPPGSPCPFKHDFDTLERINGRYFSIIAYSDLDSLHQVTTRIVAANTLAGSPVRFTYELRTRHNDSTARHFQRDALRLLRTVRIRPGR